MWYLVVGRILPPSMQSSSHLIDTQLMGVSYFLAICKYLFEYLVLLSADIVDN